MLAGHCRPPARQSDQRALRHTISPETPDENIFAMYEVAGIGRQEIFDRAARMRQRESQ